MKIIIRFMAVTQQFERCQVIKKSGREGKNTRNVVGVPDLFCQCLKTVFMVFY